MFVSKNPYLFAIEDHLTSIRSADSAGCWGSLRTCPEPPKSGYSHEAAHATFGRAVGNHRFFVRSSHNGSERNGRVRMEPWFMIIIYIIIHYSD